MSITSDKIKLLSIVLIFLLVGSVSVCRRESMPAAALPKNPETRRVMTSEPIAPIPQVNDLDPLKVVLGERLFNDPQLSHDNTVSCASCHNLQLGGTDQASRSTGINGQQGDVNAPTVFNAGYNFKQFWDGRADSLEQQIDGPTHASGEMGSDWGEIVKKLGSSEGYSSQFSILYRNGITTENIKDAIATYERSLVTPDSRFDQYLRGNQDILSKEEKDGYHTFKSVGCISCHQGINIGGNLFQEFGVMGAYFADRGNITKADLGRYNVTHLESDRYVFKVPSLRNVNRTFPYFHNGSAQSLEDAVTVMSKYQLGRELSAHEIDSIVTFLRTLDGEYKRYNER